MKVADIYVRRVSSRGRGPYFQLVESYRPKDTRTPRTRVLVHLGVHPTAEDALVSWPEQLDRLRRIGRDEQADRLASNLEKLRALVEAQKGSE
jgi:hypothetical protein